MNHLFKGIKHVTNESIESEFLKIKKSALFEKEELFVDLSQVTFAQLSALNYLVLRVDELFGRDLIENLFVSYPLKNYSTREESSKDKNFTSELRANLLKNRIKVNGFLKNIQLASVLKESAQEHNVQIYFTENFDFESEFNIENFELAFEEVNSPEVIKQSGYQYLYPLEWISVDETINNYKNIEKKFKQILENPTRGLESFDVQAIKNVIFSELSKNVKEHTSLKFRKKKFLLSIGLISTSSFNKINLDGNFEKEFIEWSLKEKVPSLIEIYFGDSGGGFYTSSFKDACKRDNIISEAEQLRWSFNKWTSKKFGEERRGTKGLYRINRIVNNYNGIFHIITNNQNGGFRKGGLREPRWENRKVNTPFNGSFIQIKLCPYSVVKKFKLRLINNNQSQVWKTFSLRSDFTKDELEKRIEQELKTEKKILCVIDLDKDKDLNDEDKLSLLKFLLLEISYHSHPSGVVVYVNSTLDKSSIDLVIDSINEYIKSKTHLELSEDKDNEVIYDPVIVLYGNSTYWYGGNQIVVNLLNEVYENNFDITIDKLSSFQSLSYPEKIKIRQGLENDNRLVHVDRDGKIELIFYDIESLFSNILKNKINDTKEKSTTQFCTPKVYISDYWLKVQDLIRDNELGFALVLYLKSLKYISEQSTNKLFVLIDHKQHIDLAYSLLNLLNLKDKHLINIENEIQVNSLKRFKLIPEKSNVIILTSIVSSSETVRRLVKYVKRDNAVPLIVLSLCNFRKYNINELETWGSKTSIESVYKPDNKNEPKVIRDNTYFERKLKRLQKFNGKVVNPDFKILEKESKELIDADILNHFEKSKSLNYNHIGIKNDRHFTFYIDKPKLLNSESIISKTIESRIENWIESNSIEHFTIYLKNDLFFKDNGYLKQYFSDKYPNCLTYDELPTISYSESLGDLVDKNLLNVFIIDFGLISGQTVNQMLNDFEGLENLFICILFDQSYTDKFEHYKRLNKLKNLPQIKSKPTNLNIEFLFKLPLKYYDRENCPICNHIDALEYYKMSDDKKDYMFNFSEDRQRRLQIRKKLAISRESYPFDFYYEYPDKKNQELSSTVIKKMFNLKLLLEDALINTNSRISLFEYLYNIYSNCEKQISEPDSDLYATVYYLSNEVHWLQKEPLVFRDFRIMLSKMSSSLSTIDRQKLIELFKGKINNNVSALDSATRYKYAAISLLRSSNKLEFCEKIYEIVKSSSFQNGYSNNLMQNSFYHTFSILKNKYNKSNKYFAKLKQSYSSINEIAEIPDINDDGSYGPRNAIDRLHNIITSKLTEIDIESLDDIEIIKQLKLIYDNEYKPYSHPDLEKALGDRSLLHLSKQGLTDISIKIDESLYYQSLWLPLLDINQHWSKVKNHIYKNIITYYKQLSENIKNSRSFRNDFVLFNILEKICSNSTDNPIARFSGFAAQLNSEPITYLQVKPEYDKLHKLFYDSLIKKDSEFNVFINQFPLNISESVENSLFKNRFEKFEEEGIDHGLVFYPRNRFKSDLNTILASIRSRTTNKEIDHFNEYGKFENIICRLDYSIPGDNKYKYFRISYDNTNSDPHDHPNNEIGGLSSIKQEVRKYGGDIIFSPKNDENGFFNITYKLMKYE